ncbi:hypothetical protein BT96DRAFT_916803 [Gymnopus androsaceus JB14]|uniref:Uncharacterized protein n=1 Tax=Gymnopus androsaceus JB14 TaxID=1447944 RepID=A0A6A4HYG7_9AGAR|nr:hypothetical protein BT96DRAFT_916803 [Gymnopus androsaceus JB14]
MFHPLLSTATEVSLAFPSFLPIAFSSSLLFIPSLFLHDPSSSGLLGTIRIFSCISFFLPSF